MIKKMPLRLLIPSALLLALARAQLYVQTYEKAEGDLMTLIEKEEEARGRSVIMHDVSEEFAKFIKLLYATDRMHEFDNIWVSNSDEARSVLYVTLRRSAFYFHMALSAALNVENALKAEKARVTSEQARGMRKLLTVLESETSLDEKASVLIEEDKKKVTEAFERAKTAHDIARIKLNGLRYDCARTVLVFTCRWLGNYRTRVEAAERFEGETTKVFELNQQQENKEEEVLFYKDLASDPKRIQAEIEIYSTQINMLNKKLSEVEPKTKLLKDIDVSLQTLLRRDDLVTYSPQQSVANLELLLHQTQDFYSRFVLKNGLAPSAPPHMIAQLTDHHIVELSDKFGKVISNLDFGSMLDYDEYARTGGGSSSRMELSFRGQEPIAAEEINEFEFMDSEA